MRVHAMHTLTRLVTMVRMCALYVYYLALVVFFVYQPSRIDFGQKWRHFGKCFQAKGLSVAHALTIVYIIYNTVGWSIATSAVYIFTSMLCALVNMLSQVIYIGDRPPYCIIYITCRAYFNLL